MRLAKIIAWLGVIAMTAALYHGFFNGNFFADGSTLLSNPWGVVSMVDLYTGFVLFSMWIAFRENNKLLAAVWIVLMMVLGFFAGSVYVLMALTKSKGSWLDFYFGSHKARLMEKAKQ
jgi:hypothetical protein